MIRRLLIITIFFSFILSPFSPAFSRLPAALDPVLKLGIRDYNDENYEEVILGLEKFRAEHPSNALGAYYLGLAYRKSLDFHRAIENLNDALTLDESLSEALVELAEVSFQIGNNRDALKFIEQMEAGGVEPAIAAFLHGMVFLGQGRNSEAIKYLELAEELDEDLSQSVRYQIGVAHMMGGELRDAADVLGEAVEMDPESSLAINALDYLKNKRKKKKESRLKIYANIGFDFDDNVILEPINQPVALGISNKEDKVFHANYYADYTAVSRGPMTLKGRYALYYNRHDKNKQYDYTSYYFSILPSYKIGNSFLNIPVVQGFTRLDNKEYLRSFSITPAYFHKLPKSYLSASFKYSIKDYLQAPVLADNDRDANHGALSVRWIKFLMDNQAMVDIKYEISREKTDGNNWSYRGKGVYLSSTLPLVEKMKIHLAADFLVQRFDNIDTYFLKKRNDNSYTLAAIVTRSLSESVSVQFRFKYIRNESNLAIYDYERTKLGTAMEYRY